MIDEAGTQGDTRLGMSSLLGQRAFAEPASGGGGFQLAYSRASFKRARAPLRSLALPGTVNRATMSVSV